MLFVIKFYQNMRSWLILNIKMKELPESQRPRERLIIKGAGSLSDEELLAIALQSGTKDVSAKTLSQYLLKEKGNLKNLKNITYHELIKIKGIGSAKACLILAIIELSKRLNINTENLADTRITSAEVVYEYYKYIVNPYQEHFYCIYLDSSKKVLREKLLFIGTVNQSMVHPRDVFKEAYLMNATAFICVHNHPTGDVNPSKADIEVTSRLRDIGILMGIKLVDHVIIGDSNYYSFLENGKL